MPKGIPYASGNIVAGTGKELNYIGSIGYRNDDAYGEKDKKFWAYLFEIVDVYGHSEDEHEIHKYEAA